MLLLSTTLGLQGQLQAPTEDYSSQTVLHSDNGSEFELITPDGVVITHDANGANLIGGGGPNGNVIPSFANFDIPSMSNQNTVWTNEAHPSVFQAHWMTPQVVDIFESLGITFNQVTVGANFSGSIALSSGDGLNNCIVALGTDDASGNSTPSFAEYEVIAHEMAHCFLGQTSFPPYALQSQVGAMHEGFAFVLGDFIESQLSDPSGNDYTNLDDVLLSSHPDVRSFSDPVCATRELKPDIHAQGMVLAHWYYLLSTGALGIVPIDQGDIIELLINSFEAGNSSTDHYEDLRDLTLNEAVAVYGACSREVRSIENAWDAVLNCIIPFEADCTCNPGEERILEDQLNIDFDHQFDGDFRVTSGRTLKLSNGSNLISTMTFPPGTGIIVENGGKLILEDVHLKCCFENQLWQGITLLDGAEIEKNGSIIEGAIKGLQVFDIPQNITGGTYVRCSNGIFVSDFHQDILLTDIRDCRTGIHVENRSNVDIYGNDIDCTDSGIYVGSATARIGGDSQNWINQRPSTTNGVIGKNGITALGSFVIIDDNIISATEQGIEQSISHSESRITDNTITVTGDNSYLTNGIYSWFTNNIVIRNNKVLGNGIDAAIYAKDTEFTVIDRNTIDSGNTDNGIAVTSGQMNKVLQNEVMNDATNAIGVWASSGNEFHDNDIAADNVGLLIGRNLATSQTITCNRFCDGNIDVSVASYIDEQPHHRNQFRPGDSRARVIGLDPLREDRSRGQ